MYSNNEFDNNSEHEQNEEVIAPEAANFTYNSGVETNFCCPIDREIHNKDSVILIENVQALHGRGSQRWYPRMSCQWRDSYQRG